MAASVSNGFGDDDEGVISDINVTPMVDVTLVLLIVFMITVPAIVGSAPIKIELPQSNSVKMASEMPPWIISVQPGDGGKLAIYLNERKTDEHGLLDLIKELGAPPEGQGVTLAADRRIPYGEVVRVLDLLHAAGLDKIAVDTQHVNGP